MANGTKTTMTPINGTLNSTLLVPTYLSHEEFLALRTNATDGNFTVNDTTIGVVFKTWYPSGYSPAHIIIASVVVTVLMIMVVVGNMLVIIAIVTEKSLKNIQNWFIASLAVSDFFLGLVIMPFSLANELMGYWIFGFWWCEIHSAMDVLLCTASIMNLCLISLDRYWSITQAVDYLKKRTPARAALMIAAVWLMSALVCIPPLLGWRVSRPPEQFPQCKNRIEQNRTEQNRTEQNKTEQKRTEQNRTEQNRTEQSRAEQSRAEQTRAEQNRTEQNRTE
ncbi:alpha-2C adrenergic receptor-like [Aricia agestis]|uniref:alpha-2C adrenergic receptor-like n=1 Tax=Aricia agestis TaxID=91739 RepID=UPI001C203E0B|nr:alpha-2C adrenergic receptor-like [Aricia agestis]